jgi:hypothetical protein
MEFHSIFVRYLDRPLHRAIIGIYHQEFSACYPPTWPAMSTYMHSSMPMARMDFRSPYVRVHTYYALHTRGNYARSSGSDQSTFALNYLNFGDFDGIWSTVKFGRLGSTTWRQQRRETMTADEITGGA